MDTIAMLPWPIMVRRLIVAFALGGVIGSERERRARPAGLRTHILVTTGAALLMMMSQIVAGDDFDPGRIAAGVITGMGFLGAGTIIRYGNVVRGLTTAASLWAGAGVGLAIGIGWYAAGIVTTILIFLTLMAVRHLEPLLAPDAADIRIMITLLSGATVPSDLVQRVQQLGGELDSIEFVQTDISQGLQLLLCIRGSPELSQQFLSACLSRAQTIKSAHIV